MANESACEHTISFSLVSAIAYSYRNFSTFAPASAESSITGARIVKYFLLGASQWLKYIVVGDMMRPFFLYEAVRGRDTPRSTGVTRLANGTQPR